MDEYLRGHIAAGDFLAFLAEIDPDAIDVFRVPGLPAPFGTGEEMRLSVAVVGRVHLHAWADGTMRCHAHEDHAEAMACHRDGVAQTQQKIEMVHELQRALRSGDPNRIARIVGQLAGGMLGEGVDVRTHVINMGGDGEDTEVLAPVSAPPAPPTTYQPGRPTKAPDTLPPDWTPGMYL